MVEKSKNYVFGANIISSPPDRGERGVSYKIRPLFTCGICYWEVYRQFLEGEGGIFHGDNFQRGGKFLGINFPRKILHWRNLSEFLYEILFFVLLCLYRLNFTSEDTPGNFSTEFELS